MISFNMILDRLADQNPISSVEDTTQEKYFHSVWKLQEGQDPEYSDTLYICPLETAMKYDTREFWFCVPVSQAAPPIRQLIQVPGCTCDFLFKDLFHHFCQIIKWDQDMAQSLIDNEGIQHLLNLSEPIIGNHISISDPSLKLVAYTRGVPPTPNDYISSRLLELGYHGEENIAGFRARRMFDTWATEADFIITDHPEASQPFSTLVKSFKCVGGYSLLVVMSMSRVPYSLGLRDRFKLLTDRISYYANRDYPAHGNFFIHESFFADLVERRITNPVQIQERCDYLKINYHGHYNFMKISFADTTNTPLRKVLTDILNTLPLTKGAIHGREILLLNSFPKSEDHERKRELQKVTGPLKPILQQYNGFCGISTPFSEILEVYSAHIQSDLALSYGRRLSKRYCPFKDLIPTMDTEHDGFFKYDDYFIYHLLDISNLHSESVINRTACILALDALANYDLKNNTDNVRLLYFYLLSDRKASVTGELFHMHRNNVMYRVKRIEEIMKVDLNNPDMRFKLLLAYKYWELYSSQAEE